MKMKFTLVLLCAFLATGTFAQNVFKVLVNKGKNEVKVGSTWQSIKVGGALGKNDEIKIAPNSYLGLVHVATGKPVEIKEARSYSVSDLESRLTGSGASVMAKYADFILSSNNAPNNSLKATGAVHRGPANINVYLPTVPALAGVFGNDLIINWDSEKIKGPYIVTLSNPFEDELHKGEIAENSVFINLGDRQFSSETNVKVHVVSKSEGKSSPEQLAFRILSKAEKEKVRKIMESEGLTSIMSEQSALARLMMAGFYESQKLLIDAATAYQQAIRLAPDVPEYQAQYLGFLQRTSLKEPKQ